MATNRFQWAIDRQLVGPLPVFDVDLYKFVDASVCPTLGSIVPGWLLVIPRLEAICFADLRTKLRREIQNSLTCVREDMSIFVGKPWIFEHGARFCGSTAACGVDQAHLHIVPLEFDLLDAARHYAPDLHWIEVDSFDPWAAIDTSKEYYFVGDFAKSYVAYPPSQNSQFFRRVIATKIGCAAEWDYRVFSHERNAEDTARRLSSQRGQKLVA